MYDNDVVVVTGKAGSGKTHCCCGVAADYLKRNLVDQIIISRPIVAAEKIGFLKGDYLQKFDPYVAPILNEMDKFLNTKQYIEENKILILPVAFMRGWNFSNSFVLIDECQNLEYHLLKLIITRLCDTSKMVFMGDGTQSDLDRYASADFLRFVDRSRILSNNPENKVGIVELLQSVRHPLVEKFLEVL